MEYIGRIEKDRKLFENENKIVIFGAGKDLGKVLNALKKIDLEDRIICICDNDSEKQGKKIEGLKVCSVDEVLENYKEAIYLVYNRFCIAICKQLVKQGIDKIHLIRS